MEKEITFKDLKLNDGIQKALEKKGYKVPTPIQAQAIPGLLSGKDLIGIAQTGTGKTASFVLPILQKLKKTNPVEINALILVPTRELATQVGENVAEYGKFLDFNHTVIFGGTSQGPQVRALERGVNIVVATPGRLMDLLNQRRLNLSDIEFFVLDEADRMLDMGFLPDIKKIVAKLPARRQSLFFSATMSSTISTLAKTLLDKPLRVEITPQATAVKKIKQCLFFVDTPKKEELLFELLEHEHLTSVLVFTRTKHKANQIESFLLKNKIKVDALHGNKSQNAREKAIRSFKNGKVRVLVATDIAARGIDIDNISHVINFEMPNEAENYVHRIGRTARAGKEGTAYSFCESNEKTYLKAIEKLTEKKLEVLDHTFHSERAKTAEGEAARPPKRGGSSSGGRRSSGGRNSYSRDRGSSGGSRDNSGRGRSRDSSGERKSYSRDSPSKSYVSRGSPSKYGDKTSSAKGTRRTSPKRGEVSDSKKYGSRNRREGSTKYGDKKTYSRDSSRGDRSSSRDGPKKYGDKKSSSRDGQKRFGIKSRDSSDGARRGPPRKGQRQFSKPSGPRGNSRSSSPRGGSSPGPRGNSRSSGPRGNSRSRPSSGGRKSSGGSKTKRR